MNKHIHKYIHLKGERGIFRYSSPRQSKGNLDDITKCVFSGSHLAPSTYHDAIFDFFVD